METDRAEPQTCTSKRVLPDDVSNSNSESDDEYRPEDLESEDNGLEGSDEEAGDNEENVLVNKRKPKNYKKANRDDINNARQ